MTIESLSDTSIVYWSTCENGWPEQRILCDGIQLLDDQCGVTWKSPHDIYFVADEHGRSIVPQEYPKYFTSKHSSSGALILSIYPSIVMFSESSIKVRVHDPVDRPNHAFRSQTIDIGDVFLPVAVSYEFANGFNFFECAIGDPLLRIDFPKDKVIQFKEFSINERLYGIAMAFQKQAHIAGHMSSKSAIRSVILSEIHQMLIPRSE